MCRKPPPCSISTGVIFQCGQSPVSKQCETETSIHVSVSSYVGSYFGVCFQVVMDTLADGLTKMGVSSLRIDGSTSQVREVYMPTPLSRSLLRTCKWCQVGVVCGGQTSCSYERMAEACDPSYTDANEFNNCRYCVRRDNSSPPSVAPPRTARFPAKKWKCSGPLPVWYVAPRTRLRDMGQAKRSRYPPLPFPS